MDTEFINVYIDTLIKNLHDLTSKNVVLETKLAYQEKTAGALQENSDRLQQQLEELVEDHRQIANDRDIIRTELGTIRSTLEDTNRAKHSLEAEVATLKKLIDDANIQVESLNDKIKQLEIENSMLKSPVEAKKKTPKITDIQEVDSFTE